MNPIGAAPSFFPTAKELSSGLQWFRDHPVLAAAAATAVSAITYWSTTEARMYEPEEERSEVSHSNSALARKSSSSEGKLSNSVSWSDEHGGSLTEVFEELVMEDQLIETSNSSERRTNSEDSEEDGLQIIDIEVAKRRLTGGKNTKDIRNKHIEDEVVNDEDEIDEDDEESERRDKVPAHLIDGLPPRKKNTTTTMKRSGLESPLTTRIKEDGSGVAEIDIHSESPQWGWYVAITPPQDPELPRAIQPTMRHHQTIGNSSSSNTGGGSLRRSTSGRIQK
jgi:hypothetical protein